MKDCFGREIEAGDIVAYASATGSARLSVGEVIGPCKKSPDKIRVKVFKSSSYRFRYGRTSYATGKGVLVVPPGQPIEVTLSMPSRVIIVDNFVETFKP